MQKRILAALLCAILIMALLPAAALAATYDNWDKAIAAGDALKDGETITIGDKDYTYKGDVTTATRTLDLTDSNTDGWSPLPGNLVWKAGERRLYFVQP